MEKVFINGNEITINGENEIILSKGATLKAPNNIFISKMKKLKDLRDSKTIVIDNLIKTTEDLTFKSKSALACFVEGGSRSGNEYFAKANKATTPTTSASAETKIEEGKEETPSPVAKATKTETKKSSAKNENAVVSKETTATPLLTSKEKQKLAEKVINFCQDFSFKPDPRLLNTIAFENPDDFIVNSMELAGYDSALIDVALNKFKSAEWDLIKQDLAKAKEGARRINKRLVIFYGDAGTGKTTKAIEEIKTLGLEPVKIIASATADPDDLFTTLQPAKDGKVEVVLTQLGQAMTEGRPIIIDEANLYNAEVLARLQGVTDNTDSIYDRKIKLDIKDGFKVIITMNLETNLGKNPLPNPLISRANRIEKFDKANYAWIW